MLKQRLSTPPHAIWQQKHTFFLQTYDLTYPTTCYASLCDLSNTSQVMAKPYPQTFFSQVLRHISQWLDQYQSNSIVIIP